MIHRTSARLHLWLLGLVSVAHARLRAAPQAGQGTVEYVALVLLVAVVLAAAVKASTGKSFELQTVITSKLKDAIESVGGR